MAAEADVSDPVLQRLTQRSAALGDRWCDSLRARSAARHRLTHPQDGQLGAMSEVARWVVASPPGVVDLTAAAAEALGGFVLLRRSQGQLLEEVLVELRLLQDVLLEALEEEVGEWGSIHAPLALARGVAERMSVVATVAAGMFNEEVEQERRAERRKLDDFTRTVSHEMRTPIGAAYTAARMLQEMWEELPGEERERMLDVVSRGLSRATGLLESVMSIALARTASDGPTRPLRDVVEDAVAEVREHADHEGVRVEVAGPVPNAAVDARRVHLVLHNLLSNAVRYADGSKEDRWVRIKVERDHESYGWRVQVGDNGAGIRRDEQEKIFQRFYRAQADRTGGTGLGLVIAREAAEKMGGEISVESVPGVGSTFAFVVPDVTPDRSDGTGGGA